MMDKLSEGITSAFNTAGTEANKAKLQTEIAMKQHQIKGIKQEFGVRGRCIKSNRTSPGAAPTHSEVDFCTGRGVGPHGARRHRGPPGVIQAKAGDRAERHRRPRQAPAAARRPGRAQADARRVRDRAGRSHAVPKSISRCLICTRDFHTGAKEGESIEAKASDGSTVRITVPAGTAPGATLHVRVPVALPPPVDPTVPVAQGTPVVTTTAEPAK